MFLNLAKLLEDAGGTREQVFLIHPLQLSRWLDEAWAAAALVPELPVGQPPSNAPALGSTAIIDALDLPVQTPPATLVPAGITVTDPNAWTQSEVVPAPGVGLIWHHLSYAYVTESTGVWEIFTEVVRRLVVGDTLGELSPDAVKWLRATEELFFRDPPLFSITGIVSELRPQARISRRNAYWRMFGFDVPHAVPRQWDGSGGQPWKADVGAGVNSDFRAKWSELLRQVWLGLENSANSSGSNPTDPSYVAFLCRAIKDMFNDRRRGGLLAREEFAYVTALSWFHLTLQSNTAIVTSLKAEATSPAERLATIGQRVGMEPAQRARELFDLAEPMSSVLRAIEVGSFDTPAAAETLFDSSTTLGQDMRDLINVWQSATGERVKERPISGVVTSSPQPLRIPAPGSGNSAPGMPAGSAPAPARTAPVPAPASAGANGQGG